MLKNITVFALVLVFSTIAFGQTPAAAPKPVYFSGELLAIGDKKLTVKDAKAGAVEITINDKSAFKKASAENTSLAAATAGKLEEIVVGDKLTISALQDGSAFVARNIYYIAKADLTAKHEKEKQEWRTRGIAGKVGAVNPQTNQVTVEVRGMMGNTSNVVVTPKPEAKFKRYASDSIKYDEAKDSSLGDIKAGDMIRILGDKSADGTSVAAEQLVSGAFQTIAGTVKSVDAEKGEVVITELQTKKDVTVVAAEASVMKRFPAETAERMAGAQTQGGARPPGGAQPAGGQGPTRVAMGPGGQGGPGMRPGGGGNLDEMIERFPNITVADLKAGDMIAISSTKNGAVDRIKAIKLLAGVEPFIRMAQMAAAAGGGRRGGGVDFNIPGLDGIGFP